jgi:hypothetical protein
MFYLSYRGGWALFSPAGPRLGQKNGFFAFFFGKKWFFGRKWDIIVSSLFNKKAWPPPGGRHDWVSERGDPGAVHIYQDQHCRRGCFLSRVIIAPKANNYNA